MKNIKKLLALLLCAGLLMTSVPLQARAETTPELPDTGLISHVNPLYAHLIDDSAVLLASDDYEMPVLGDEEYFTSVQDAGAYMRKQMVERDATVTVGFKTTRSDYVEVFNDLMDEAMKHTGVPNEGDYIMWQYSGYKGGYSKKSSGGYNLLTYSVDMDYFTTLAQEQQVNNKLNQIYAQLNVNNASDYNKVKAIYDYICSNITYDFDNPDTYKLKHSAWAGLINNTCVCQGYALIFYRMCLNYGVDARLIAGDGGGPHGWNIVKLGNLYYNVDSTWDAGNYSYRYFLKGSYNFTDHQGWEDYTTPEFKSAYPISTTDYVSCEGSTDRNKHSYKTTRVEPTCTAAGSETEYCSVCGAKGYTTTLPAVGHNYQNGYCTRCGHSNAPTSGSCGTGVNWSFSGNTLNIYGSGAIMDNSGTMPWAPHADRISYITIGEGINHIGNNAFGNMKAVTKVTFPSTLRSIGEFAFAGCGALKEANIPTGVTIISAGAFNMCSSLASVTLPLSLSTINSNTFAYCTSLTSLTIPARVTVINDSAFYGSGIKKFVFMGNAPYFSQNALGGVTATAIYPADDSSWQTAITSSYGGNITWRMDGQALDAPVLRGSATASGQIKLAWNTVYGADRYYIYRASGKGGFAYIGVTYGNLYTDSTAVVGTAYQYYITAGDASGNVSGNSNIVACTISILAPEITKITNVDASGKIKLTWNAVPGAMEYKVYRATSKNGPYSLMKTVSTGTSYTNTSAKAGTRYYYYVVAVAPGGATSGKSNIVYRVCDFAKPTGLSVSNVASTGKIKVSWEKVEGAAKYQVYRATSKNGTYSSKATVSGTSWTDPNSTAGKTYYYKVKAVHSNTSANSVLSGYKSRMADLKAPVVKITTSSGKPKVSWAAVTGAKEYKIYRSTSKNGTYKAVQTTTAKSWKDTTAKKGKTYYYKVIAVHKNSGANSAYSTVKSIKCTK